MISPSSLGARLQQAMNTARKAQNKPRTLEKGGRTDLATQETAEIGILQEFLPADIDPAEIRAAVRAAIVGGAADVGKVMAQVMPRFKGKADGKVINQIVREELEAG